MCTWSIAGNFDSEIAGYTAQFFDIIGEWTVVNQVKCPKFDNVKLTVILGFGMDAGAGFFPCIAFIDKKNWDYSWF